MTSELTAPQIKYPHRTYYKLNEVTIMPDKHEHQDYDPDELIGTAEAAEVLGITQQHIGRLIKDEEKPLPAQRIGRTWVIRRGDLEDFRDRPSAGRPKKE